MVADATNGDPSRRVQLALRRFRRVRWLRSMRYCFRPSRTECSATMLPRSRIRIRVGKLLDLDDPAGAVRHAVIVATDRDEAIVAHAVPV
jgi:hypothetical protein